MSSVSQQPSPSEPGQMSSPQPANGQTLKDLVDQMTKLCSNPSFKATSTFFEDSERLQKQLDSKIDEVEKLKEEMMGREENKKIAVDEMFQANRREKAKWEEVMGQIGNLQETIEEKEKAFRAQEGSVNDLRARVEKLQSDYDKKNANLTQAHTDISTLQQNLKEKETRIDKMKVAGLKLREQYVSAGESVKTLKEEKDSLEESLKESKGRLSKLESFAVPNYEGDEDSIIEGFIDLWEYAKHEIYSILNDNLSREVLQNHEVWETFRTQSAHALQHHVHLPNSNSPAAKHMRLAVVLAILAREIDKHIFQPSYIMPVDAGIREVLNNLAASDSEKESYCRSILLSIDPDTQIKTLDSKIQNVVATVSSYLYKLLSQPQYEDVRLSIEKVVKKAIKVWHPIQRASRRYESDFEPLKWDDSYWSPFTHPEAEPEAESTENSVNSEVLGENLLTVFPRISSVEKGNRSPFTVVVQLRRSQKECVEAEQEIRRTQSSPTTGRMVSNRSRRKSIAVGSANGLNGSSSGKKKAP